MFFTESELRDHRILYHFSDLTRAEFLDIDVSSNTRTSKNQQRNEQKTAKPLQEPCLDDETHFPCLVKTNGKPQINPPPQTPKKHKPHKLTNMYDEEFPSLVADSQPSRKPLRPTVTQKPTQILPPNTACNKKSSSPTLQEMVKDFCSHDAAKIEQFMVLSGKFYQGKITASSYRKSASFIIGKANMDKLIPVLAGSLQGDLKQNLLKTEKSKKYISLNLA